MVCAGDQSANRDVGSFASCRYTPIDPSATSASHSSSTSAAPTASQTAPTPAKASSSSTPIIAGVVGGVLGLLFFLAAIFYVRRRRQNHVVDLLEHEDAERGDREDSTLAGAYRDHSPRPEPDETATVSPFMASSNTAPASTLVASSSTSKPAPAPSKAMYQREAEATALESSAANQGVDPAFIREMMQHNVPGPEIATMIRAAVDDAGGMVPPPYDSVSRGADR